MTPRQAFTESIGILSNKLQDRGPADRAARVGEADRAGVLLAMRQQDKDLQVDEVQADRRERQAKANQPRRKPQSTRVKKQAARVRLMLWQVAVNKVAHAAQVLQCQPRAANVRVAPVRVATVRAGERVRELLPTAYIE